jgi:hypothetical protein
MNPSSSPGASTLEAQHIAARARFSSLGARFEGATLLLASSAMSERIAGIALLRALWQGDEDGAFGEAIEEVLSAFVRRRTAERSDEAKLAPDVQSALSALGARPATVQERPLDLSGARLRGVEWPFARLRGALLMNADLGGALLAGADLRGAWLRGADLSLANLDNADLRGADLRGARGSDDAQLRAARSDAQTLWPQPKVNPRRGF